MSVGLALVAHQSGIVDTQVALPAHVAFPPALCVAFPAHVAFVAEMFLRPSDCSATVVSEGHWGGHGMLRHEDFASLQYVLQDRVALLARRPDR